MAFSRLQSRLVGAAILLGFVMFLFYWVQQRTGTERELVYDLSRVGRTDLSRLEVTLLRDGELVRSAQFFYPPGEGKAPTQQRHRAKLREGTYRARFSLRFGKAAPVTRELAFALPGGEPVVLTVPPAH